MLSDRLTANHFDIFGDDLSKKNLVISLSGVGSSKPFQLLATPKLFGLDYLEKTQGIPLFIYDIENNKVDNITDWGLTQFLVHYEKQPKPITKLAIFHYVYAVLHDPIYREKYTLNLKREFPRVPFYEDFWLWADWGSALMDAHIGYEAAEPYVLKRTNKKVAKPKAKLKADKENGLIILDEATWEYVRLLQEENGWKRIAVEVDRVEFCKGLDRSA